MAKVITAINEDYKKRDGTCQVSLRIYLMRKKVTIDTGVSVEPGKWDYKKGMVKGKSKEVNDKNLIIEQSRARVNDILVRYRLMERDLTPALLKSEFKNPANYFNFIEWLEKEIKDREGLIAHQTTKSHNTVLKCLKMYRKSIAFSEIDRSFIEGFEKFLKLKLKNNNNTVSKKMSILKGYFRRAMEMNIIRENPLRNIRFKKGQGNIEYLNEDEVKSIIRLYRETTDIRIRKVLKYFLFACFTGLRISDVRRLSHDNIINNIIVLIPQKTFNTKGEVVKIPLNKTAIRLIYDQGEKQMVGSVFEMYSDQKTNQFLKEIGRKAGVEKSLHFHMARHTFATLFLEKTNDLATLQKLMGHSSINQTMIYAHVSEKKKCEQIKVFDDFYTL